METVKINGMSCMHCVNSVKEALEKISGIDDVEVDLDQGIVIYSGKVDKKMVEEAIDAIGFEVK